MPIYDIYSKRQKKLREEMPDVYVYDDLPKPLRIQIIQIWRHVTSVSVGFIGAYHPSIEQDARVYYDSLVETLRHEYGVFWLTKSEKEYNARGPQGELEEFFLMVGEVERALDVVELSCVLINEFIRENKSSKIADDAIEELNNRFKEHGVGYQFTNGQIIRIDSEFIHTEIVKPALNLLSQQHYAGAQQEFLKAHEHYRKGNAKEALSECLKAFESVMKAICDKRGWNYSNNATAKPLIQACFDSGLIPSFWQSHYSSLRNLLECSVPTGRNKLSGHGQGTTPVSVPNHLVAYMLHMTASAIVFLAEADKNSP